VVARHPLDMAVSLYHQGDNLDRDRAREMIGGRELLSMPSQRPTISTWLRSWINWDGPPAERLDSLKGVMSHLSDAWARRHNDNIVLVHYDDLINDLEAEMRRLATVLDPPIGMEELSELAGAATFEAMRAQSDLLAPDPGGVLKSRSAFFRRGTSGAGAEILSARDLLRYEQRARDLAPGDLLVWLHR
jgi:aryl sulfotransferase